MLAMTLNPITLAHACTHQSVHLVIETIRNIEAQQAMTGQTDLYLVILSSNTYVFEDKLTKY